MPSQMQVTEESTEAPAHLLAAVCSAIESMAFDISDDELRVEDRKLACPFRKHLLQETPCEQSVAVAGAMGQTAIIDDEGRKVLNDPLLLRELDRNSGRDAAGIGPMRNGWRFYVRRSLRAPRFRMWRGASMFPAV